MKNLRALFEATLEGDVESKSGLTGKKIALYLAVVVVAGAALMLGARMIPDAASVTVGLFDDERPMDITATDLPADFLQERALEERLEEIFSLVDGAGKVRVLVSPMGGREMVFATDTNVSRSDVDEQDAQGGTREQRQYQHQESTVTIGSGAHERPLVLREIMPRVEGIVIIAEGGDDVHVRDALTRAAQTVLGLGAHRVQVLKMAAQ